MMICCEKAAENFAESWKFHSFLSILLPPWSVTLPSFLQYTRLKSRDFSQLIIFVNKRLLLPKEKGGYGLANLTATITCWHYVCTSSLIWLAGHKTVPTHYILHAL
jgi:hypothetical protein